MTLIRASASLIIAAVLLFGTGAKSGGDRVEEDQATMTTYSVGHMVNGQFTELGTLAFDGDNAGALSLNGSSADHERLDTAWSGIADQDVLHIRRSEPTIDEDGDEVFELIGVDVERSSDEYPEAVFEYLSRKFGFFGVEVESAQ